MSFGASGLARDALGAGDQVNKCSGSYKGGEWAGMGVGMAMGGAHLGRNAVHQMGRTGGLGQRIARGVGRLGKDNRGWGSVRDTWSRAAGGGTRNLNSSGRSLHHWGVPQRWGGSNAGWNYVPISARLNSYMNGSTLMRQAADWAFRAGMAGAHGAIPTGTIRKGSRDCP